MPKTKYIQRLDGEGFEIPNKTIYNLACCDCGLVHRIVIAAPGIKKGVAARARTINVRDRRTAALRNTKKETDHMPTPKQSRPGGSSPRACSPVRAFRVTCDYWQPPIVSICRVTSPQKARFACWESANDVGYKVEFGHLKVRRAPEYDNAKLIEGRCYGEDFARNILPENDKTVPTASTATPQSH